MARIRSVKPEFWVDRKLARLLSRDERMLYVALWNQADEHARLQGDPRLILGQAFPYDDDLDAHTIDKMLDNLASAGVAVRYEHDGDPFIHLPKLATHQRLEPGKAASKHPAPPAGSPSAPTVPDAAQIVSDESAHDSSEPAPKHGAWSMEHGAGGRGADEPAPTPVPPIDTAAARPPPCTRHPNGNPTDEACGGCARRRQALDAADAAADQTRKTATLDRDRARRRREATERAAAIDVCQRCGDDGRMPSGSVCTHTDPAQQAQAAQAARAALAAACASTHREEAS